MTDTPPVHSKWKLDRTVPLAMIIGMGMQFIGFVWFASDLNTRVGQLEKTQVSMERAARIEEQVLRLREDLGEIKTDLKALLRKP